ncbi:MAG: ATP-binding cassette domain-containing protein, partial [bacterium]
MEKTRPLVSFSGADLGYNKTVVLESVNFELCQGDYVGIIGPNGSGKTTL